MPNYKMRRLSWKVFPDANLSIILQQVCWGEPWLWVHKLVLRVKKTALPSVQPVPFPGRHGKEQEQAGKDESGETHIVSGLGRERPDEEHKASNRLDE